MKPAERNIREILENVESGKDLKNMDQKTENRQKKERIISN